MRDVSLRSTLLYVTISIFIGFIFRSFSFYQIFIIVVICCSLFIISFFYVASRYLQGSRVKDCERIIRPLVFSKPLEWIKAIETYKKESSMDKLHMPIHESKLVSDAFDEIIELIIRDFVVRWYKEIAPQGVFPIVVEKTIRYSLIQLGGRIKTIDIADVVVRKIIPIITSHIAEFSSADAKVQDLGLKQNLTDLTELNLAIAKKYNNGKLHPAVTFFQSGSIMYQKDHLRKSVGQFIGFILPESEMSSKIVSTLVREVISCGVLSPIIELLIDPDILNQLIETISGSIIQERKKIKYIRNVLKKHALYEKIEKQKYTPKFPLNDDKMFERYIRFIKRCNNLSNLRKMRNDLVLENHKFQSKISSSKYSLYSNQYINDILAKFYKSKYYLEKQIGILTGNISNDYSDFVFQTPNVLLTQKDVKLIEILHNVSGLSYFMEFMDQKNRIVLVQFWFVVNDLNNPFDNDISSKNDPLGVISIFPESHDARLSYKEDISTVFETYFSENLLNISEESRNIVKEFIESPDTPEKYHNVKIVLSKIQNEVFDTMQEEDLPGFIKSEFFLKYLTTMTEEMSKNLKNTCQNHLIDNTIVKMNMLSESSSEYNFCSGLNTPIQGVKKGLSNSNDIDLDILKEVETALNGIMDNEDNQNKCKINSNIDNIVLLETSKAFIDCSKKSSSDISSANSGSFNSFMCSTSKKTRAPLFEESEQLDIDISCNNQNVDVDLTDADIHHASPGDLTLSEAIDNISLEIDNLVEEESVLNSLIKKAELTNSISELKIFKKSIKTIQSEVRRKKYQRQQYIIQESDNLLYGRSKIFIPTVTIGLEMDGSEYTLYIIEIQKFDSSKVMTAGWILGRRYSEFFHLHQRLKAHFPKVRNIELPKKSVVLKMQKSFIEGRRIMLEKYLQTLLQIPEVCASKELRIFLSQQNSTFPSLQKDPDSISYSDPREIIGYIFKYFSEGVEDLSPTSSFIDNLSENNLNILDTMATKENVKSNNQQTQNLRVLENDVTGFTKPICDLFLEIFDLKKSNNWLKGRAIIIILQQLLGGAIERKFRETLRQAFGEQSILNILETLKNTLWPNGILIKNRPLRSYDEKIKTRLKAGFLFSTIFPGYLPDVAHKKLFNILQNPLLNSHLVFSIFDQIIEVIFPEIKEIKK